MDYRIDIYDTWGRHVASYDEVPIAEASQSAPDEPTVVTGLLPGHVVDLSHGYRVRVTVGGQFFTQAYVTRVSPQWSDTRKLILDRYVSFHEVIEFEAQCDACDGNVDISMGFTNQPVSQVVRDAINAANGPIRYSVNHTAYPDGAEREYEKFLLRKSADNEMEVGGITQGQWVGAGRIDASAACACDGDTIQGLVVDGVAWPDVRLMMIDSEERVRNSHARVRHPEVAGWTDEQYANSGYKLKADAAANALDTLIQSHGIDFIELNPHRDTSGAYDDRVDDEGRYIGLVYGGGQCFNAAQVERGHADVYLWEEGKYPDPSMALKDFFSYAGVSADSIEDCAVNVGSLDVRGGLMQALTALAYIGEGYTWSITSDKVIQFRKAAVERVAFFDPARHGICLGSDSSELANIVQFAGNPLSGEIQKRYERPDSVDEYGNLKKDFAYFSISTETDADNLVSGLLNDIAYPETTGFIQFHQGQVGIEAGDIVEVRDGDVRRLERETHGEWNATFNSKRVARVRKITHRFSGKQVSTVLWLTSPLRSVSSPLSFIARGQESAQSLYQFRLDEVTVGLDMGYHMD